MAKAYRISNLRALFIYLIWFDSAYSYGQLVSQVHRLEFCPLSITPKILNFILHNQVQERLQLSSKVDVGSQSTSKFFINATSSEEVSK